VQLLFHNEYLRLIPALVSLTAAVHVKALLDAMFALDPAALSKQ
jgi:hypothetical protein